MRCYNMLLLNKVKQVELGDQWTLITFRRGKYIKVQPGLHVLRKFFKGFLMYLEIHNEPYIIDCVLHNVTQMTKVTLE